MDASPSSPDLCRICLQAMLGKEKCFSLDCTHTFHVSCLFKLIGKTLFILFFYDILMYSQVADMCSLYAVGVANQYVQVIANKLWYYNKNTSASTNKRFNDNNSINRGSATRAEAKAKSKDFLKNLVQLSLKMEEDIDDHVGKSTDNKVTGKSMSPLLLLVLLPLLFSSQHLLIILSVRKHTVLETSKGRVYVCKLCNDTFDKSYALANHVKSFCPQRALFKKEPLSYLDTASAEHEGILEEPSPEISIHHMNLSMEFILNLLSSKKPRGSDLQRDTSPHKKAPLLLIPTCLPLLQTHTTTRCELLTQAALLTWMNTRGHSSPIIVCPHLHIPR